MTPALAKIPCQEASTHSRETFVACSKPGAAVIFHQHDGRHVYVMCAGCAEHNVRHRGGVQLYPTETKSNFHDVQAFHDRFGLERDRPAAPRLLPDALLRFRLGFLIEELAEFAEASGARGIAKPLHALAEAARTCYVYNDENGRDLVKAFDSLLDLNVVSCGTADFMGVPWEAGWDVVMGRNLAKRRAKPDGPDSKRGSPFDVVKPEGWYGPEAGLRQLLLMAGWNATDSEGGEL